MNTLSKTPARRRQHRAPAAAPVGAPPVTLEMVAKAAGVSPSTVSRILNGSATVSAQKQQAVDSAIARLGFRPNPVARGLAGGRTLSIGVVTQTISSPFYGEALHGIEDRLESKGYIPLFVSGHWHEAEERKAIEALLSRRVDGLIVLAGRISNADLLAYAKAVPMVVVGRDLKGPRLFSFGFDNRAGGLLATRHLVECGHTRIAFVAGDRAHEDALEREAGYREALQQAGIAFDPALVVKGDFTESGGLQAVNQLLDGRIPFTAIFAANDQSAIGAALGLYRRQVRVPDDVSLVGFDDVAPAKFSIPPLTTVRQSVYEMGSQAAAAVLALIDGGAPDVTLPPPQLVPRESTRRVLR
ncbi:MAG TPA: LacI family DNA-binding transcriptional regulator [Burkholderiaceae bacterium]|nr:LacI family DNA-binding transcriptional regulator [Burkholderiaceae bacterium]